MSKSESKSNSSEIENKNQRLALLAIVNYEIVENATVKRRELISAINRSTNIEISSADFNNFVSKASRQGSRALYDYYKPIVSNETYYNKCPSHIRNAITECFGFRPPRSPVSGSLLSIFKQIADVSHEHCMEISQTYAGVWNVFRYSGHQGPDVKEDDDPYVTRAAMEVFPKDPDDQYSLPQFVIHYRPQGWVVPDTYNTVEGVIIPFKESDYMSMVGFEKNSRSPLDILTTKEIRRPYDARLEEFTGLVKRKHEFGHFMVARVHCIRESNKSLAQLTPHIGMFKQSELSDRLREEHPNFHVKALYERIGNRIANKGRASLRL